jgi:hypothetical protein
MNFHRALVETLLILIASTLPSVLAYACRDDQYEQCVLDACQCLSKVGGDDGSHGYPPLHQSGAFCYTPFGRFGPGPMLPIGAPCSIRSPQGLVRGQVGL